MLSKKIYTQEYISVLRGRTGDDPLMIERTLFAFGLLEAITRLSVRRCHTEALPARWKMCLRIRSEDASALIMESSEMVKPNCLQRSR